MTNNRISPQFTPDCTKGEVIFGFIWLTVHMLVLPLLTYPLSVAFPDLTELQVNAVYYAGSLLVCLLFGMGMLRREFDHLMDRPFRCLGALLRGYLIWYAMSAVMLGIMGLLGIESTPPNDQAVDLLAGQNFNITLVISVIAAPILEEILFRGVLFQSIRKKSRVWAYIASLVLFGVYHTWQYALYYGDISYLLYSLQYIPITFAITWSYERSGSLWTAIFFHASNNYLAMQVAQMM